MHLAISHTTFLNPFTCWTTHTHIDSYYVHIFTCVIFSLYWTSVVFFFLKPNMYYMMCKIKQSAHTHTSDTSTRLWTGLASYPRWWQINAQLCSFGQRDTDNTVFQNCNPVKPQISWQNDRLGLHRVWCHTQELDWRDNMHVRDVQAHVI